ncbi:MAG: hypothetical protein DRI36_01915 [Caldiserica bacterium]|nr:MAG: hypothetical protein DRI36_01915 [Caldisericota bacterium]
MIYLFIFLILNAQISKIVEEAAKSYVRGEYNLTYKLLRDYLEKNPEDEKAKKMFVRTCIRLAKEHLNKGEDEKAHEYASLAYKYDPDDPKVENLYLATRKLSKERVEKKEIKERKIEIPRLKPLKISPVEKKKIRKERERVKEIVKVVPKVKVERIIEEKKVKVIPLWVYISIILNLLLIVSILFYSKLKKAKKKSVDKKFYKNLITNKLLLAKVLKEKKDFIKKKIPSNKIEDLLALLELPEKIPEDIRIKWKEKGGYLPDFDPIPRLISEKLEIFDLYLDNPNKIVGILKKYLDYPHNRVRATACKILAKYRLQDALRVLKKMAKDEDRWMRISAIWALENIGGKEVEALLEELKNDPDYLVSEKAEEALKRLRKNE